MQKTMNTRKEAAGQGSFNAKMARETKIAARVTECERLGRDAFDKGLTSEATTDARLMALVNERATLTTLEDEPDIVAVFKAWICGWHAAENAERLAASGREG